MWWAKGEMKKQELGKESEGATQGLAWASAARERVWGLCGFGEPHRTDKGGSNGELASV